MEKYEMGESIGSGCYGVVFKALDCETNRTVAIKVMNDCNNGVPSTTLREISVLREMNHENIVKLLDVKYDDDKIFLIFEYLDLDLMKYMKHFPDAAKNPQRIKNFLHQILSGVAYFHRRRIIHRDLHPSNLLIDINASVLKIADFGLARTIDIPPREYSPQVGRIRFRSPEVLLGAQGYSFPVDVWSVGCIFAEMLTHQPLFDGTKFDIIRDIFRLMGTPDEATWPKVTSLQHYCLNIATNIFPQNLAELFPMLEPAGVDLLSKMLCLNPAKRVTTVDALEHAYFTNDNDHHED